MKLSAGLFKKYDIRGVAMGEKAVLTREAAYLIGHGIGTYLQRIEKQTRVVVGRDNRHSSFELQDQLMEGLKRSGCKIIDIGLVSTPLVYWHAVNNGNIGGVMVTGSHLSREYNGFKLSVGSRNIYDTSLQKIAQMIEDNDFTYGDSAGDVMVENSAYSQYIHDLETRVTIKRPLKVVIDPGNGTGGLFAPRLMHLWGLDVTGIFIEPDGDYPNHQPDPSDERNLKDLSAKVLEIGADIGIAFDGDADRMGAVDEKGQPIAADRLLAMLAQDMLKRHPGAIVIGDVLCSQVLFDAVKTAGGVPLMAASGHSIVKDAMRTHHALLGGEQSGHIFLGEDYFGFDDAYLVAGRLIQLIANGSHTLSELDNQLPRLYSTPEYRPHCPDNEKANVIRAVRDMLQHAGEVNDVDGVRVQFAEGWGLLRASNTEPVLSLRFEATTREHALAYRDAFARALANFPHVEPFGDSQPSS